MFKKIKVGSKITALVLSVTLISVLAIGFIAFNLNKKAIEENYLESLQIVAEVKAQKVTDYFGQLNGSMQVVGKLPAITGSITASDSLGTALNSGAETALDACIEPMRKVYGISNVYLTDADGKVLYQADKASTHQVVGEAFKTADANVIAKGADSLYYSNIVKADKSSFMLVAAPLQVGGESGGLVIYELDMAPLFRLVGDTTGLGLTGETILSKLNGNKVVYLNAMRNDAEAAMGRNIDADSKEEFAVRESAKGKDGAGFDTDYRSKQVFAAWRAIPQVGWGITVKIDTDEAYQPAYDLKNTFLLAGLITLFGALMVGIIFSHLLTASLISLKSMMSLLGQGVLPERLNHKNDDEIGEMAETVNNLVEGLKKTANFAHKIGDGDFDADFKPMSAQDTLGLALLGMRDNIQESAKRDDERNWIVTGIAEIGDILRSNDNLDELGDLVISYLTRKIGAIQGAFYVVNDENKNELLLEMTASYAYNKKKYLAAKFRFAEGLVGQAAIEQDTILRTEVPDKYVTITSGLLGDRKPSCLLIVPLITVIGSDRVVYGAVEFAGFDKFSPRNVQFVKEVSEIIARTVFNIKVNATTRKLLQMSQKQSEELQEQQEVLRQNAEEMEATQEELKRSNVALEEQVEEVNRTQKRMQVLLENASEVITIYEEDGRIRYISPSVERILGYAQNEMIGLKDIVNVHPAGTESYQQMFADLLAHPNERITIQFSYKAKDGSMIWLEATGTNLLNDPAIAGLVLNTRDITERRMAEKESRMRGQMQALSENSPDLITRLNKEGKVFYINPIIESYTGHNKEEYLLKSLEEIVLDTVITEGWRKILDEVLTNNREVSTEMDFPSVMGNCVMQVNAIPEYNDTQNIESVLVVSHDITERKLIEVEIQAKNKKITESINYAKRIQGAILPDTAIIQHAFKDAFIMYKPRDVVSGDFPWFMQKGDDIYIAAVDCTGHGVPGALISLIGYFLLNDIVNNGQSLTPGAILDQLDEGVTRTLKQDASDSATRDGMDIALCRINNKEGILEFSGAHRSLYYTSGGELSEIKADKFPIGGAQYKTRTNFTTTRIEFKEGDGIFFCSDGLPDQFGGPENRKFSPKRIRELIVSSLGLTMAEMCHTVDTDFEAWKGENKQTDDVLMIGIKL